jgi:pSer/pThr/pTyr-binding forkhead associated (FHA) protein
LAKLVLSLSGNVLNQYFTDKSVISIGRSKESDIAINDALLSREHARINTVGEDHIIEDMESSNGTLVNGVRATRKILRHRDVIGLGNHTLQYLNTRMASDVDLERTMVIQALPREGLLAEGKPQAAAPSVRAAKAWLPDASIKVITAEAGEHSAGDYVHLDRVVTTFGVPGERLIVITRRPQGYFLTHVEGRHLPRLNGKPISAEAHPLHNGDTIEAAGCQLEFLDSTPA